MLKNRIASILILLSVIILNLISCSSSSLDAIDFQSQDSAKIYYKISGNMPLLSQPKSMDCWATVFAILFSWKHDSTFSIDYVMQHLGKPWKNYFDENNGLPANEQDRFLKVVGLQSEPPANYTLTGYHEMLKEHGPLWITTGDVFSAHARIMIAIKGDGTYSETYFQLIDPLIGKILTVNALDFAKEFEKEARVIINKRWAHLNLRFQIIHW